MAPNAKGKGPYIKKEGQARIGGVDIPRDPELAIDTPKPTALYPHYLVRKPKPLEKDEKAQIARFRSLRESIHNGPLYTVLGDNARVGKRRYRDAEVSNPFEGMPKYSQKYTVKKREIPKLDTRPYVLKFFPKELWSTLDPKAKETNGVIDSSTKGKSLQIPGYEKVENLAAFDHEISGDEGEEKGPKDPDEEEPLEGEEVDDEYDDDEEDGGDYNAEQYFDDGGDDMGDDLDGGDEGGGGDYY
ncbi:hypothetical protein MMC28_010222 [Mycoblastus sanguinarius]|nr:hypothetical protein [Mycoblastus sanguinarius]